MMQIEKKDVRNAVFKVSRNNKSDKKENKRKRTLNCWMKNGHNWRERREKNVEHPEELHDINITHD